MEMMPGVMEAAAAAVVRHRVQTEMAAPVDRES